MSVRESIHAVLILTSTELKYVAVLKLSFLAGRSIRFFGAKALSNLPQNMKIPLHGRYMLTLLKRILVHECPNLSNHNILSRKKKGTIRKNLLNAQRTANFVNWEINLGLAHLKRTTITFIYWFAVMFMKAQGYVLHLRKQLFPISDSVFKIKLQFFLDTLIQKRFFRLRK